MTIGILANAAARARIAVKSRELDGRFIEEALEAVRLPEFAGA